MKLPKPRKLPSGNWFIRLRLNGESIPITALTEKDCINQARLIKAEYKADKRIERDENKQEQTLGKIVDDYIASRKAVLSVSTISGYKVIRKNRFKTYMDKKPSAIRNWQAVINDETKLDISAKTLKNSWALIA